MISSHPFCRGKRLFPFLFFPESSVIYTDKNSDIAFKKRCLQAA